MIKKNHHKSFRQSIDEEAIKMIELLKPFQKKKKLRTNIIFRKPTFRYLNKPSNSKLSKFSLNLSYKNPLLNTPEAKINKEENKNKEYSDKNLIVSKYLNESMPNEIISIGQSSQNSKLNSYRQTINYSSNPPKGIIALYTQREPKKNSKLPILDLKYKNSLLKKTETKKEKKTIQRFQFMGNLNTKIYLKFMDITKSKMVLALLWNTLNSEI
jgi:hypothetical protein